VVGLFNQWPDLIQPLTELRAASAFEIFLHPVRPEVEGWTTHHGIHTELTEEVEWVLGQPRLADAVDGFVFGIRPETPPCDGFAEVQRCLSGTDYQPLLHVPCVNSVWKIAPTDEVSRLKEVSRVAEAVFLARAHPDTSIVIDNFVELDRGYFDCGGLVDRFYNPKDGGRVVTTLNALLPRRLEGLEYGETVVGRVVSAESEQGAALLILPGLPSKGSSEQLDLPGNVAKKAGTLINLTTGETSETSCRALTSSEAREGSSRGPMLFVVKN
jgi:hypothetical protein